MLKTIVSVIQFFFARKGSVIVLFSIEFKNDTNITHTDESINEAFQGALLNASAFTNLTLDLNSSKIGNVLNVWKIIVSQFVLYK